jgi:hypothetical protein
MPKPTPTQEEHDRAALGEHVLVKEFDGSELENPPARRAPPPEPEPKKQKQMEATPPAGGGYQTRQARPE